MLPDDEGRSNAERRARRRRRRRLGIVCFLGVETLGFQGEATQILSPAGCGACLEAGVPSHPECATEEPVVRLYGQGLVRPIFRDGEWHAELTDAGVEAFQEIQTRRHP